LIAVLNPEACGPTARKLEKLVEDAATGSTLSRAPGFRAPGEQEDGATLTAAVGERIPDSYVIMRDSVPRRICGPTDAAVA